MSAVQAGALPFNGPYAQRQLEALRAYQAALAQVNQNRNQYLGGAGYIRDSSGHLNVNTEDPYSAYSQMQMGIGQDTRRFNTNFDRSWGDLAAANEGQGIGGMQHSQFQQMEGGVRHSFATKLLADLAHFTQAQQGATQAYNTAKLNNRNQLLDFLMRKQQFSRPKAVK